MKADELAARLDELFAAAGILDGAGADVALGGSRLARFMKEVEAVTAAVPSGEPIAEAEEMSAALGSAPLRGGQSAAEARRLYSTHSRFR